MKVSLASNAQELLDQDRAAAFLGIRAHTLEVWRTSGRYALPFVKIGRCVRYKRADLEHGLPAALVRKGLQRFADLWREQPFWRKWRDVEREPARVAHHRPWEVLRKLQNLRLLLLILLFLGRRTGGNGYDQRHECREAARTSHRRGL